MAYFGSEQGLNDFVTGRIVHYFEDFKRVKTQLWAKIGHLGPDTRYHLGLTNHWTLKGDSNFR